MNKRLLLRFLAALALAIPMLASARVGPSLASTLAATCQSLTGSTFEGYDGNLTVDNSSCTDWVTPPPHFAQQADVTNSGQDNVFGGGPNNKEDSLTPPTGFGNSDNKNDLSRMYIGSEIGSNQHVFLYLGWERIAYNGAANEDFEINQSSSMGSGAYNPPTDTGLTTPLNRTDGDLLIQYNFGGSGAPSLDLWTWANCTLQTINGQTGCYKTVNGQQVLDSNYQAPTISGWTGKYNCLAGSDTPPCWSGGHTLSGSVAQAAVNSTSVPDPVQNPAATCSGTTPVACIGAGGFGEAIIDLTNANVFTQGCETFGSAWVKGRTSPADTASLKDFVAPTSVDVTNCGEIDASKYIDVNANGTYDSGTDVTSGSILTNFGFTVKDSSGTTVCSGSANSSGTLACPNLTQGTYTVTETNPTTGVALPGGGTRDFVNTDPTVPQPFSYTNATFANTSSNVSQSVSLSSGGSQTARFGNTC